MPSRAHRQAAQRHRRPLGALIAVLAAGGIASPALGHSTPEATPGPVDVPAAATARAAEPPLEPTPQGTCGPGSRPETGMQGRVPPADHVSGRAAKGYTCNTRLVGAYRKPNAIGTVGGFKVERYVDAAGHDCAYYDTTLMYPTNLLDQEGGVNVLDMSDPANPKLTARLLTPAMLSPHESLVVSKKRGVLAAVMGNLAFNVGVVDVYDISQDCRHPVLRSSTPVGLLGHESGMAPDGRTFYSASPGTRTLVGIDISNPSLPAPLWLGNYDSHGLSISNDGNRAYVAGVGSGLIILDTSEVQARVPNPTVREVSRLQWEGMSIPQNAIPVKIDGDPYLVEIDEFGSLDEVGAARIIDIGDETRPRVVSNMRLEVHQPENFDEIAGDNGATNPVQGYAGHYCNVPRRIDPGIVACSMILSGLRVFDIRDPRNPREIAYYNAPVTPRIIPAAGIVPPPSNWAMASPSFVRKRGEIWYSDGLSGFYAVRVTNGVWPVASCQAEDSTIVATGIRTAGTRAADVIVGRKGKDRIASKRGRDAVCGKGGNDTIKGGGGADKLSGGAGRDRLVGGGGRDRLVGGGGRDRLVGGGGRDRLKGGGGRDRLKGGRGNDLIRAARGGRDRLDCGPGRDTAFVDSKDRWRRCERVVPRSG